MAKESSFDIVSQVDRQEVKNAVQMTMREIANRFDFKGSDARVEEIDGDLLVTAEDAGRVKQLRQMLEEKLARRGVSMKALDWGAIEDAAGGAARSRATVQSGLSSDQAKAIVKRVRDTGLKVQARVQGDQVRVSGKKRDDLQAVIAELKRADLPFHWTATNYR